MSAEDELQRSDKSAVKSGSTDQDKSAVKSVDPERKSAGQDKAGSVKSIVDAVKMEKNVKDQFKSDKIDDCQKSPLRFARFTFCQSSAQFVNLPFVHSFSSLMCHETMQWSCLNGIVLRLKAAFLVFVLRFVLVLANTATVLAT